MEQKEVIINGIRVNHKFGILEVCELEFDEKINMYVTKGKSGHGKSTSTTAIKLATMGTKTLVDNDLYGEVDIEAQLTDGDIKLWVSCKSVNKSLQYTLFTKDSEGKKIKNPVIDGVEATPAKYLDALQTELTWKMDELTSENPSVQKKILLKLYQSGLKQHGIIFDTKHPDYKNSILGQIEDAINKRNEMDTIRKMKGGIADDLKAKGHDPDRPETCPDYIDLKLIEQKIKDKEKEKTQKETNSESVKEKELAEIKASAQETINRCLNWNKEQKDAYDVDNDLYSDYHTSLSDLKEKLLHLQTSLERLGLDKEYDRLHKMVEYPEELTEPTHPTYIILNKDNQVDASNIESLPADAKELVNQVLMLRQKYVLKYGEPNEFDSTEITKEIESLEKSKIEAIENNKICDAIDSFHKWREANANVVRLQDEYLKLLAKVNTGVEGLKIVAVDNDIFLMYDGSYNPSYFQNPNKELRKISSYSGTQKPVICLLIQNYLLSQKPKAMRYLHIDNIPIDKTSKDLLEKMSKELNLRVFLNITGDFDKTELSEGEVLIEGGEIFFK